MRSAGSVCPSPGRKDKLASRVLFDRFAPPESGPELLCDHPSRGRVATAGGASCYCQETLMKAIMVMYDSLNRVHVVERVFVPKISILTIFGSRFASKSRIFSWTRGSQKRGLWKMVVHPCTVRAS